MTGPISRSTIDTKNETYGVIRGVVGGVIEELPPLSTPGDEIGVVSRSYHNEEGTSRHDSPTVLIILI